MFTGTVNTYLNTDSSEFVSTNIVVDRIKIFDFKTNTIANTCNATVSGSWEFNLTPYIKANLIKDLTIKVYYDDSGYVEINGTKLIETEGLCTGKDYYATVPVSLIKELNSIYLFVRDTIPYPQCSTTNGTYGSILITINYSE